MQYADTPRSISNIRHSAASAFRSRQMGTVSSKFIARSSPTFYPSKYYLNIFKYPSASLCALRHCDRSWVIKNGQNTLPVRK